MAASDPRERFAHLETQAKDLEHAVTQLRQKGLDVSYQRVALRIIKDFVAYGLEDLSHGEAARAETIAEELSQIQADARSQIQAFLDGRSTPSPVPKFRTSKIAIRDGHFQGMRRWPDGRTEASPIIFTGHGHFDQVRRDLPKFDDYGVNVIQIEIGPTSTVVGPEATDTRRLEDLLGTFDRAAEHNVSICLLLSPHYFPEWAFKQYPHLSRCEGGFIKFCIDAPEARDVVARHIRLVISKVKEKIALHSICLTNEPIYRTCADDEYTKSLWAGHLNRKFKGDMEEAKEKLRTNGPSFEEFPIPDWRSIQATPLYYEWCVFNHQRFADWHRWMADVVHDVAPEIAVHAKIMPTILDRRAIANGVDPLLFSRLSQVNGNDCWCMYRHEEGEYAQEWLTQNMFYDLLRSFGDKPIFNTENHIIKDRERATIPWQHVRTALWQGAIHGQCATTIWVWERTFDEASDFAGSIMHRPLCVRAVGETSLDLMRFSREVTALQNARPGVGLLYSIASIVYEDAYLAELKNVYEALNFTGRRICFLPAPRLAERSGLPDILIAPNAWHVETETAEALAQFVERKGKLIIVGKGPERNEHDEPLQANLVSALARATEIDAGLEPRKLRSILLQHLAGPAIWPADSRGGIAWGVEWLDVHLGSRWLLNAVNLLRREATIRWTLPDGRIPRIANLLSGQKHDGEMSLKPMEPLLAQVTGTAD